jgi:tetratricopeptide (TPR) repeat protein
MVGEYREDIQYLLERFRQAPHSRLFAPLADAYRKNGEVDRGIELCETGLERHPTYASAHVILGKCFYDKGATERARSEFVRVIELDPENMVALKFLGDILVAEGDREGAARYYRRLVAIDATNNEVAALLKELEEESAAGRVESAGSKQVKRTDAPRELATMTLAGIYAAQGYHGKALAMYRQIVASEPENREAREMLEKLQAKVDEAEEERRGAFEDEVLTISLDDVSDDVASSTTGRGGIGDEVAEVVRELEIAEREPDAERTGEAPAEEGAPPQEERAAGETRGDGGDEADHGMSDFQRWIGKMRRGKDRDS